MGVRAVFDCALSCGAPATPRPACMHTHTLPACMLPHHMRSRSCTHTGPLWSAHTPLPDGGCSCSSSSSSSRRRVSTQEGCYSHGRYSHGEAPAVALTSLAASFDAMVVMAPPTHTSSYQGDEATPTMAPPTIASQSEEATPLGLLSILPQEALELLPAALPGARQEPPPRNMPRPAPGRHGMHIRARHPAPPIAAGL